MDRYLTEHEKMLIKEWALCYLDMLDMNPRDYPLNIQQDLKQITKDILELVTL